LGHSAEFEHGFTDRFQASLYLNGRRTNQRGALAEDPDRKLHRGLDSTFQCSIQVQRPKRLQRLIRFVLYIEPEYQRIDKISGERVNGLARIKLIFAEKFLRRPACLAYNLTSNLNGKNSSHRRARERIRARAHRRRFLPFLASLVRWRRRPIPRSISEFKKRESDAYFLGPNIHYAAERWWFTFTFLPQVSGNPRIAGRNSNGRQLSENERYEYRFKIAFNFS